MNYNPAFDGLRAIAIILVILFHARAPFLPGGFIGVDIFFVLSGFLITKLLTEEYKFKKSIDIKSFYIRRFFRLTPALFAMLFAFSIFAPHAWPQAQDYLAQAGLAILYLSDYSIALFKTPDQIGNTWSLAVEEHFYIVWPFAIIYLAKNTPLNAQKFLLCLYIVATAWRIHCTNIDQSWQMVYYRFDTRVSGLILGSLTYYFSQRPPIQISTVLKYGLWLIPASILLLQYSWGDKLFLLYGFSIAEFATAFALLLINQQNSILNKMLSLAPLVFVGKISYGLYLWHYPIFRYFRGSDDWMSLLFTAGILSLIAAIISYYFIEKPVRTLSRNLTSAPQA